METTWPLAAALALALAGPAFAAPDPIGFTASDGVNAVAVTTANPLPVTVAATALSTAPSVDASGTVASGGVYQTVFAANTSRKGCLIQNPPTATEVLNVRVGGSSVFYLAPGAAFRCGNAPVLSDVISVTGATTSHAFSAVSQ